MSRSRIAIFEGYGRPSYGRPPRRKRRYGFSPEEMPRGYGFSPEEMPRGYGFSPRTMPRGMGGPIFNNPRVDGYGRRAYYVPPMYGPTSSSGGRRLNRKGYKVKKGANSKWQKKFKRTAELCSRRRNKSKVTFQQCMAKKLGKKRRSKR